MVKKIMTYACEKCGCTFDYKELAEKCERLDTPPFKFNEGDFVFCDHKKEDIWEVVELNYKRSGAKHKKQYLILRVAYKYDSSRQGYRGADEWLREEKPFYSKWMYEERIISIPKALYPHIEKLSNNKKQ
jgi:hypothetical protein